MKPRKIYALTVAKKAWVAEIPIIVVQIPWDQFSAAGGPEAYTCLVEQPGVHAVIVSRPPGGQWVSSTKIEKEWRAICEATPLDSLEWHTMAVEADHYPWELFGQRG